MKNQTQYIKGLIDSIIILQDNLALKEIDARCSVSLNELSKDYDIEIYHNTDFDLHKDEFITESKSFTMDSESLNYKTPKFEKVLFDIFNYIEELENVKYNPEYNSKEAREDFESEMYFEASRGN